jgi:hypothetical protein
MLSVCGMMRLRAAGGGDVGHGVGFGDKKRAPNDLKPSAGWSKIELEKTVGLAHNELSRPGVAVTDDRCVEPDEMVDLYRQL